MKHKWILSPLLLAVFSGNISAREAPIEFRAAGSLKAAMTDIVNTYQHSNKIDVSTQFAPSGLLRKRIEGGEKVDLFASANMKHPTALNNAGLSSAVVMFARNKLCALAQPEVSVTPATLLEQMLNDTIRLGTSTPKADPAGDYAWKVFERAQQIQPNAFKLLSDKALQLTGGPTSAKAPDGSNPYAWVMENKQADIFLTYCTNAVLAKKQVSKLQIIALPDNLSVGANYGLTAIKGARPQANELAEFIISPQGQAILAKYGFDAP
ncbi:molybdate ABC transporter substrate-binding protein [Shewanella psychrotolerans]|uniref:molybdate ABC transporter substrate-binding protein n=1 Tax=Shewanella psychrotolerans TaxID=2864206 RepID=UPI001C65FE13|nr:molybdate ABC transporter substrate-binding protein [Shewanella psychrotolerans]QYK02488.1 molybdate ABC transporter substrate-binding protein [Shewanella psychrotolerans]